MPVSIVEPPGLPEMLAKHVESGHLRFLEVDACKVEGALSWVHCFYPAENLLGLP